MECKHCDGTGEVCDDCGGSLTCAKTCPKCGGFFCSSIEFPPDSQHRHTKYGGEFIGLVKNCPYCKEPQPATCYEQHECKN